MVDDKNIIKRDFNKIFIPGNVISSKNSKQIITTRNGIRLLTKSKAAHFYVSSTKEYWVKYKDDFISAISNKEFPLKISFTLIRKDKRRFDYINLVQLPLDLMVSNGWIPDDDSNHVIPIFEPYLIDKNNPGLIITIL